MLEDVDNCHLMAQLNERNNSIAFCNITLEWDQTRTKVRVMKRKKLELKAHKMQFQLRLFNRIYVSITYRKCLIQ